MSALLTLAVIVLGLLAALAALRVAPPALWLHWRHGAPLARAIVLVWLAIEARRTWDRFTRDVKLAHVVEEGRITSRAALWSIMPGVRVERRGPDRYKGPKLRVRANAHGLVGTIKTTEQASQTELAAAAEKIADKWGMKRISFAPGKPGRVRFRAVRYEPLADDFPSPLTDAGGNVTVWPGDLTSADDIELMRNEAGKPIAVNLRQSAHGLIAGVTRSGKSITVNSLLASASLMSDVRLVIIDPNLAAAAPWWRTAYRVCDAQHPDEAAKPLADIREEMQRRQGLFWQSRSDKLTDFTEEMPLYLVVVDELTQYTKHSDKKAAERFTAELLAVASQGAKFGVRLWLLAQKPEANVLPTAIRTNLSSRICHRVDTTEDFLHLFPDGRSLGISAADREMPPGTAIAHVTGMQAPQRAKSVYLPTEACWQISDRLVDVGHGVRELPGPVLDDVNAESA